MTPSIATPCSPKTKPASTIATISNRSTYVVSAPEPFAEVDDGGWHQPSSDPYASHFPIVATRILLADDEVAITSELAPQQRRAGFEVSVAEDGNAALRLAVQLQPDCIVLDVLMPACDGREVCRRLRAAGDTTPVVMLTQFGASGERAMALEEGADDYLNKPFDPTELVARIRAVLRRTRERGKTGSLANARWLVAGSLALDRSARRILLDGRPVALTAKALAVLEYLMLHQDEVLSRDRLLDEVWGWAYPVATRAVDVRIAELRRALHEDADRSRFVETVIGEGYRFAAVVTAGTSA
jgi:DNA-binding response OmpR family regulator